MLRVQPVFDSALVSIERIDHPADIPHVDPPEEMSRTCSINLLERGGFAVRHRRRRWIVGTDDLFVTVPGHVYRYDHDDATDVVVAVCFKNADAARFANQPPVVRATNRRTYLRRRLVAHLQRDADALAIDSIAESCSSARSTAAEATVHAARRSSIGTRAASISRGRSSTATTRRRTRSAACRAPSA